MSFFVELKRRNVIRVAAAYVVAAWLVIQVVETIFPAFGFGDVAIRTVVIALAIGLVPVVIFAWAFELTPEGLKREKDVDRSQSITPQTGKRLDRAIMVVLALGLGYFAFDKFVLAPQRTADLQQELTEQMETVAQEAREAGRTDALLESYGDKSIAVLPFVNMSADKDQEYFSDGIAEELLNLLAKVSALRVISRTSAFSFKGTDLKLTEVAEELNVANILEGSVRRAGDRIRITVQLIEARSDTHLWSETYDRTFDDIFAIQDEIAAKVVEQLKIKLLGAAPKIEETDPRAYSLYLRARSLGRRVTKESMEQSNALFEQALVIDPDYAAAIDGLTRNYNNQASNGLLPAAEGFALAREMTQRALALDPESALAHSQLGWIAMYYDNDLPAAARHFERALAEDPTNRGIITNAAALLVGLGRLDEVIALQEYLIARDPMNATGHFNLGLYHFYAGDWEAAVASIRAALRLSPGYLGAHYQIGAALLMEGEAQAALDAFALEKDEEYRVKGRAMASHALGRQADFESAMAELKSGWGGRWPSEVAQAYAITGAADAAFEWLDQAVAQNEAGLDHQFLIPFYAPVYEDPRWAMFLDRVGSSPAQRAAINFAVAPPE